MERPRPRLPASTETPRSPSSSPPCRGGDAGADASSSRSTPAARKHPCRRQYESPVSGYRAPKTRLHREFLYLNHDTVLNSLSALEAGKVDEILQKVNEAREGGFDASLGGGGVKAGGRRKKATAVEEELVKTRTWFSAFDAWHGHLSEAEGIGRFDTWDADVRDALAVGDTVEFSAHLVLSPVHKLLRTFMSFAEDASGIFGLRGATLTETRQSAAMMQKWLSGGSKNVHLPVYLRPGGVAEPRIVGALQDNYIIGERESIEGTFTVVGQVARLLSGDEVLSPIRVIRDVPPTPKELATINDAMTAFIEPAKELGVEIDSSDINVGAPAVVLRPIAIFQ
jgi:hypothetical protein